MKEERCQTCGSLDVVKTGPLTVEGTQMLVTVVDGTQCTLCGHLEVTIPQIVLVRLYPPNVRYLTAARRMDLQWRKKVRRHRALLTP
ncbi:MAG: hypothetical protein M1600_02330 [Firmicutes bacterium]|jgi:hypothetical protein|nr:hypothetical protein [Bacillota bacterium]